MLHSQGHDEQVMLYAFDLIEMHGEDLRREPLEVRKARLASVVARAGHGIRFNEHIEADGPTVFDTPAAPRPRGHRVQAPRSALPLGPLEGLGEDQEPGERRDDAR